MRPGHSGYITALRLSHPFLAGRGRGLGFFSLTKEVIGRIARHCHILHMTSVIGIR